ncbi:MAG: hypothetical protein IPH32_05060 [Bacteroidetes bacterium]|nr:hypothetical protein [Bacteroidota bacterium]
MNPIVKNILAIVTGIIIGSVVNMLFIMMSGHIIPPPKGVDLTTEEGLKASMHLMEPKHFIFPFLAHAIGTFVGAFIAVKIAAKHKLRFAMAIGIAFLVGGFMMVIKLPSPFWFTILDLAGAYLPMAYIAWKLGEKKG